MKPNLARWVTPILLLGLSLSACTEPSSETTTNHQSEPAHPTGIRPIVKVGDVPQEDVETLSQLIASAVEIFRSPEFEANFRLAGKLYPELFVSSKEDLVPTLTVMDRLKTQDRRRSVFWWPETFVILTDGQVTRSPDQIGFGFEGSRKAVAGPISGKPGTGEIQLGRVHLARYRQGDTVEKSCAINTMVHEISHSLSEQKGEFWMHILDSEDKVTAPKGVFEASYFIGTIAQCTYLQKAGRITDAGFHACMMTFSNPESGSRFKSLACDDFPSNIPVTPQGRLIP